MDLPSATATFWPELGVAAVRMRCKPAIFRLALLMLACSLVVLAVAAKQSPFLPKSDPAHFLSKAAKMDVGHSPVLSIPLATRIPDILPSPAEVCATAITPSEEFVSSQIARTLCRQHRSPPFSLA